MGKSGRLRRLAIGWAVDVTTPGWWLSKVKWLAGFAFTVLIGALAGAYESDPHADLLIGDRLTMFRFCVASLIAWLILRFTESTWGPDADRSAADQKILVDQMARIARTVADKLPTGKTNRTIALDPLIHDVVTSLGRAYDKEVHDVRVVVYKYESRNGGSLVPFKHWGEREPTGPFTRVNERGKAALDFVNSSDAARLVRDIRERPDPAWRGSGTGYATYISAAIRSTSGPIGMLTIDAPRIGDLTGHDRAVATLAANILAIAGSPTSRR